MGSIFSDTLVKLRKEAGFPTAYRFFYANGGDKVLGMCYRKYLMMEQGRILPLFKHMRALISSLRLVNKSSAAAELVKAWFRTMAGEEAYSEIIEPMLSSKAEPSFLSPAHKALKEALAGRKFYIIPDQLKVIAGSLENYLAFQLFSNDTGVWTAEKLAAAGVKKNSAVKVLKLFLAAKMLRKAGAGYKCPLAGAMLELPRRAAAPELFSRVEEYQHALMVSGRSAWFRRGIIRADADALANFYTLMQGSLSSAQAYAVTEKTPKSALFAIDARVVKLRDF
jgi:hypothetical protein